MGTAQKERPLTAVFMGTPAFAAVILEAVQASGVAQVKAVYTQPDRPCGRGHKCQPSAVKQLALRQGLPVLQPVNFKDPADVDALAAFTPDVLIVAAYGLILPQTVLDIPRLAPLNVHASLLPLYRGAAPIQRAIFDGRENTGVTIMRMEASLDTGPMLLASELSIGPDETAGQLHDRLAVLGAAALLRSLESLETLLDAAAPQNDAAATYAAKITKADSFIRWDENGQTIHNRIRAMSPKPGCSFFLSLPGQKGQIRLTAAPGRFDHTFTPDMPPGCILGLFGEELAISCNDGRYFINTLQPSGKRPMDAKSFACGYLGGLGTDSTLTCDAPPELFR